MSLRFCINGSMRSGMVSPQPGQRGIRLLGGAVLLMALLFLLYIHIGFASYAFTGLFWADAQGTVVSSRATSDPAIRFVTPNGRAYVFFEDYVELCRHRGSFCFTRDFRPGETVPVVYDGAVPQRDYVRDWALYSSVLSWFFELGLAVMLASMMYVGVTRRPLSLRFGAAPGSQRLDGT